MAKVNIRLDDDGEENTTAGSIVPIGSINGTDLSRLAEYSNKISTIGRGFNKMHAPMYIQDFSIAYDIASNLLYEATRKDLEADGKLQVAESIAYLENAKGYLDAHDIKDTAEARKRYVPLDPGVQTAAEVKAQTTAVVYFLKTKLVSFKMAIESTKKIAYGDMYLSPDEGT